MLDSIAILKEQKKNICNFINFSLALWEVGQAQLPL